MERAYIGTSGTGKWLEMKSHVLVMAAVTGLLAATLTGCSGPDGDSIAGTPAQNEAELRAGEPSPAENHTVEECAPLMTKYLESESEAYGEMFCRGALDSVGQEQFNINVEKLKTAVAEGRTMQSDVDAGITDIVSGVPN